jgi:hypothetical protein
MDFLGHVPLALFADASAASNAMRSYVMPVVVTLCALASLACVFFLVNGGIQYMTSTGKPEKLEHAKKIIKNALIGLVLVIAAATVTAILVHAYGSPSGAGAEKLPTLTPIEQKDGGFDLGKVLIGAVVDMLRNIVESVGQPFIEAIAYFTNATPLMGENSHVFNLWLAIVGIADVVFIVVVALLGFHVMSFASFGFDELELKHLLPQLALVFLLMNTSIFMIDAIISFSNAMIHALQTGFPSTSMWGTLENVAKEAKDIGLAGLLVFIAFIVLNVMLLIYYVGRLITLYIGAILSPLVLLLWLLPAFKDFAITALKTYLATIFVLFVHVVILLLAASIFSGMLKGDNAGQPSNIMTLIVGMAALVALLKTQGFMQELSYAASTPRAAREIAGSFMRGVGYINKTRKGAVDMTKSGVKGVQKTVNFVKSRMGQSNGDGSQKGGSKQNQGNRATEKNRQDNIKPLKTGETRKADKLESKK